MRRSAGSDGVVTAPRRTWLTPPRRGLYALSLSLVAALGITTLVMASRRGRPLLFPENDDAAGPSAAILLRTAIPAPFYLAGEPADLLP